MAVFYKWIKGCTEGANLTEGKWTHVKWGNAEPTLEIVDKSTGEKIWDLGSLLTDNPSSARTVHDKWTFDGTLACTGDIDFSQCDTFNANRGVLDTVAAETITSKDGTDGELKYEASLHNFTGPINTGSYVAAKYFNATSDVRAKENIQPWDQNALDLVSQIPVYTFNYKNDQDTVVGILAQDLLEKQHENLKLVNNTDADGINEFMTIKEGKMVFVLWKAVQELQAQVADLQQKLNNLKQ